MENLAALTGGEVSTSRSVIATVSAPLCTAHVVVGLHPRFEANGEGEETDDQVKHLRGVGNMRRSSFQRRVPSHDTRKSSSVLREGKKGNQDNDTDILVFSLSGVSAG